MYVPSSQRPLRGYVFLAAVAALLLVSLPLSSQAPQPPGLESVHGHQAVSGEVLVKLRDRVNPAEVENIARDITADRHRPVGGAGVRLFHSPHFTAAQLIDLLSRRPTVAYAEPNFIVRAFQTPNDSKFGQLWGLLNTGQSVNFGFPGTPGADVHAVPAWDITTGARNAVVGVVDTGIDYTHRDLAANVWAAPADFTVTIGGVPITCAAGTHGFNAITRTCDPMDDNDHGTHVSGTIGAVGNNNIGVVGVNWTASIIGAKFIGADGTGTDADGIDALDFLIQTKAIFASTGAANIKVLSNSWGDTQFSQALLDEINLTAANDMLFVAAAGNSSTSNDLSPLYPASYQVSSIIAVAATDNSDNLAWFSNYGPATVHLGAPGVDILSTIPNNSYAFFSGTSMATPHVSGAAALMLSVCPSLSTASLKSALVGTAEQVPGLTGLTITGGRLDLVEALRACTAPPAVPIGVTATPGDTQVTLAWAHAQGAMSYHVKRSTTPGGPYTTIASPTGISYLDKGLADGTTYYYVVSAVNLVGESANSLEVSATPFAPPDLIVSALTVPSTGAAGQVISVSDTTKNQGTGASVASVTRFYLSTNTALDSGDTLLDGSRSIGPLAPGTSSSGSTSLTMPSTVASGTYYIIAKADADNTNVESSETNNTSARAIAIGPDLIVSALTVPSPTGSGAVITISDTVKNQGGGTAGASTTRFYLSTNASLDSSDTLLNGSRAVPSLAPGTSSSGTTSVTIPTGLAAGTYYIIAMADADNVVSETVETNNVAFRATAIGPDLVVSAFTVPSTAAAGGTITVTDTTRNQGGGSAGASTTRFYLSPNSTLDATDTLLAGSHAVPPLDAGTSSTASTAVTLPAGLAPGGYFLFAKADADNVVSETVETNNARIAAISIGPDLVVYTLSVPGIAGAGSVITVTDTVKNQGADTAGPSTSRFYLSRDGGLDASDTLLDGSRAVPSLGPGVTSSGSTSLTIPAGVTTGSYFIIEKADADGAVPESSETNNTAAKFIAIGPDLYVSALTAPTIAAAGGVIQVGDTVKNQGGGAAGASTTLFYLSTNMTLDSGDVLLNGSRSVAALAPGASDGGTTPVTIPSTVAVGTYFIIAKADGMNVVAETSETNNTTARAVAIGPDLVVPALTVPTSAVSGATITVSDTTRNQGGDAAGASTTRFYLSTNTTLDSGDILLDGSRAIGQLVSGASSSGSTVVTIPAGLAAGTYYIIAKADADNVVTETSESNNTTVRAIQITAPVANH